MRRGLKILIGALVALVVLLALNTFALERQTKPAEVTVDGGRILKVPGGDLQVLDKEPPISLEQTIEPSKGPSPGSGAQRAKSAPAPSPIVLLHCYTCAIDWWDELMPLLERGGHRVIAIDLLGHGGSEKPRTGYSMQEQAQLVAQALGQLGVEDATVVGHSLGGTVATALAEESPDLVGRLVIVDQAPDSSFGSLGFLETLTRVPVIGEALWRTKLDRTIRDGLEQAFAPGFDVPDRFVDDVKRMTYNSFDDSAGAEEDYTDEEPLDERIRASSLPLLVIFGAEDQIYDAREALSAYADVRGARTELIAGAGHSPNVEKPAQTARLILDFAKPTPEPTPPAKSKHRKKRAGG